ncbi:hypothetical protein [Flavobacterium sp.]|jgi:hypothetical protein|uniref:hypothetical protein n=1 Tax=Flavobacterium sp. TaxID=239 RepID=UPI0037BFA026
MKTKLLLSSFMCMLFASSFAQDKTTVNATSSEISDNLDLRAVASIFGESKDLADFEFRLNDPKEQISNLDLNNDNQVDYLRVIESIEGKVHLIVIQAVLGKDQFQDVATVEVETDSNNRMQVQVVGDVYMYGKNYIYEPVYVGVPVIYNYFWVSNYHPYYSSWYWGYYPTYYYGWNPYPIFRYRRHIGAHINFSFQYNYVRTRRFESAYNNYYGRRSNYYETQYPNRSFERRNSGYTNRYDLDQARPSRDVTNGNNPRNSVNPRGNTTNGTRSTTNPRINSTSPRSTTTPRSNTTTSPRSNTSTPRNTTTPTRNSGNSTPRTSEPRNNSNQSPSPRANEGSGTRTNTGSGERNSGGGRR